MNASLVVVADRGAVKAYKVIQTPARGPSAQLIEEQAPREAHERYRHAHPFEKWFYILEGSFLFELAGITFSVGAGDFVLAPSNEPHVFQNTSDKDARMLVIAKPGGLENYFAELAERSMNDPANVAAISEISARYGITLLGPPIAARR